jgi:hypothetical protein
VNKNSKNGRNFQFRAKGENNKWLLSERKRKSKKKALPSLRDIFWLEFMIIFH